MKNLSEQQIHDIRRLFFTEKLCYRQIRALTGHSKSTISKYCAGRITVQAPAHQPNDSTPPGSPESPR